MCFWCPDNSGEGLGLGVWEGEGGEWKEWGRPVGIGKWEGGSKETYYCH